MIPDQDTALTVTFAPRSPRAFEATLELSDAASHDVLCCVQLQGSAVARGMEFTPPTVTFPPMPVGVTCTVPVKVRALGFCGDASRIGYRLPLVDDHAPLRVEMPSDAAWATSGEEATVLVHCCAPRVTAFDVDVEFFDDVGGRCGVGGHGAGECTEDHRVDECVEDSGTFLGSIHRHLHCTRTATCSLGPSEASCHLSTHPFS